MAKYCFSDMLKMIRQHTECDDICIVAIYDKRVDFEMLGDVGVMEQALTHIGRDLRNQAIVDRWEQEAKDPR